MRQQRRERTSTQQHQSAKRLHDAFTGNPEIRQALDRRKVLLSYAALPGEPDPILVNRDLCQQHQVWFPIALNNRQLRWVTGIAEPEPWGVKSAVPEVILQASCSNETMLARLRTDTGNSAMKQFCQAPSAVVLLPALAVSMTGDRLGQGGGYYDTLLQDLSPASEGGPLRVAVVFENEILRQVPTELHDASVDLVLPV